MRLILIISKFNESSLLIVFYIVVNLFNFSGNGTNFCLWNIKAKPT